MPEPLSLISECQVARVLEGHLQPITTRMRAGIANALVTNPVDFITNDRVHFPGLALDGQRDIGLAIPTAFVDRSLQR